MLGLGLGLGVGVGLALAVALTLTSILILTLSSRHACRLAALSRCGPASGSKAASGRRVLCSAAW